MAQDAHEAIRPTLLDLTPEKVHDSLERDQQILYQLIWDRFVASQMKNAKFNHLTVEATARDKYLFVADFEEMIKPFIESSIQTPHQKQDCLKQAVNYYHNRKKGIPQSIRSLELSKRVMEIERQVANEQLTFNLTILNEFISIRIEFGKLTELTRKAAKEKEEARAILINLYKKCYQEKAYTSSKQHSIPQPGATTAVVSQ